MFVMKQMMMCFLLQPTEQSFARGDAQRSGCCREPNQHSISIGSGQQRSAHRHQRTTHIRQQCLIWATTWTREYVQCKRGPIQTRDYRWRKREMRVLSNVQLETRKISYHIPLNYLLSCLFTMCWLQNNISYQTHTHTHIFLRDWTTTSHWFCILITSLFWSLVDLYCIGFSCA